MRLWKYSLLFVVLIASCTRSKQDLEHSTNSVYYWRTTLRLDSAERQFLRDYKVGRIYMRYFDVVMRDGAAQPNATLRFLDTVPSSAEVVPVVFVTENCMRTDNEPQTLAERIVQRVVHMNETNNLPAPRELQIDCDWTVRSQECYFAFLRQVRKLLRERDMRLSITIRLHQLAMNVPPADYGVLMVYNTGDATRKTGRNPILDKRDVQPHLRHLASYDLPLCAAYPIFGWQLLYRGDEFKAILHEENLADSSLYRPVDDHRYLVVANRDLPEPSDDRAHFTWVLAGDSVIVQQPTEEMILTVRQALQARRGNINNQVIIYSLDKKHLRLYNNNFYEKVYSR